MNCLVHRKATVLLDPYFQRKFMRDPEYGKETGVFVHHSKYLSRLLNLMLTPVGNNVVIRGLSCRTGGFTDSVVRVRVEPGMAVVDFTLVEILAETELDLDVTGRDPSGLVVAGIAYKFGNRLVPNPARLFLRWVSADGSQTYPNDWEDGFNLVLGAFQYSWNESGEVTDFWKTPDIESVQVLDRTYNIYPANEFFSTLVGEMTAWNEVVTVTAEDVVRGYAFLSRVPEATETVDVYIVGGLHLLNQELADTAGLSEPPDFAIFENRLIIRNGTYQGLLDPSRSITLTTLGDSIQVGDVLVAEYQTRVS